MRATFFKSAESIEEAATQAGLVIDRSLAGLGYDQGHIRLVSMRAVPPNPASVTAEGSTSSILSLIRHMEEVCLIS